MGTGSFLGVEAAGAQG